jgi:hypothetical protein
MVLQRTVRARHTVVRPAKLIIYDNRILLCPERPLRDPLRWPPGAQAPVVGPNFPPGLLLTSGSRQSDIPNLRGYNRLSRALTSAAIGLSPVRFTGAFHRGGHCCKIRVRCLIVSLIRGRCLTVMTKISRALSRLLPA